jgi:hypothetical protein
MQALEADGGCVVGGYRRQVPRGIHVGGWFRRQFIVWNDRRQWRFGHRRSGLQQQQLRDELHFREQR